LKEGSKDLIQYRIRRAKETLEDAHLLARSDRWNACVNRLYYSCFYAVSSLLMLDNLSSSKHSGIRSLFNKYYVKTGKVPKNIAGIYNDLFERRQEGDYLDLIDFTELQVRPWITLAEKFVEFILDLIKEK